ARPPGGHPAHLRRRGGGGLRGRLPPPGGRPNPPAGTPAPARRPGQRLRGHHRHRRVRPDLAAGHRARRRRALAARGPPGRLWRRRGPGAPRPARHRHRARPRRRGGAGRRAGHHMSVLVGRQTRLLVQGITGQAAAAHTQRMLAYGTQVVGGVVPGRGGTALHGVPVHDTVAEARAATGANTSVLYLPPAAAAAGLLEAIEAEMPLLVCLTEGVPLHDMLLVRERLRRSATQPPGPNVPGIVSPGEALVGFVPERACAPGGVGVASRSGTLAYETGLALAQAGLGQSTWVGIGGDLVRGLGFREVVALFEADPATRAVLLIG